MTLGGLRFRGRISDGILDAFCMRKPLKTIVKTMVLKLFRLLNILIKSSQTYTQNETGNHQNPSKTVFRNHVIFELVVFKIFA